MATPATETPPGTTAPRPLAVALWLAGQGIHVHPLLPGRKMPPRGCDRCWPGRSADEPNPAYIPHTAEECRCLPRGGYCHGVRAATTNPAYIESWWRQMPEAAVGVAAGPSGLLILDVDRHGGELPPADRILPGLELPADLDVATIADGLDVLALLCEIRQAPLLDIAPRTMTVRTPSGGVHYWYRIPEGTQWRQNSKKLGWQLDVKAGWGYGVAPGSVTSKGIYQAVGDCRTIAELPAWLAADLKRTGHYVAPETGRPRQSAAQLLARMRPVNDNYVAAAVRSEVEQLAQETEGGRNAATFKAAAALGRFIPTGQLSETEVEDLVVGAAPLGPSASGPPFTEREARAAARSGIRAGMAKGAA